jgi:hypothetical protein
MQIFLLLVALAAAVLAMLGGVLAGSLLLGGMLSATKRARVFAPLFLLVIPGTAAGALAGGMFIGYWAIKANENLIFLGPLGGLVVGGAGGLGLGLAGALVWWWRMSRSAQPTRQRP